MSNPNLEPRIRELLELKRMKEELEAEITAALPVSTAPASKRITPNSLPLILRPPRQGGST